MDERRTDLEPGRLSTTFLLLSPPPPETAVANVDNLDNPCQAASRTPTSGMKNSLVDCEDPPSANRSSNLLLNFPDDEVEEGTSTAQEGASLDSIGRLSDGMLNDHPDTCATSRHELSPIPYSSRASDAILLPVSTENDFVLDADTDGPEGCSSIQDSAAAEVRERTAGAAALTPTSPQRNESTEEDRRDDVNDSVASKDGSVASRRSSVGELEMERMTEELGASSLEFIRRIRAAAFRRKLDVTRSRDSLAAKERERERALAEARAAAEQKARDRRQTEPMVPLHTIQSTDRNDSSPSKSKSLFHARPVPKTTGPKGSGGLSGVPKVEKKPTTIAHSPLLGNRRGRQQQRTPKDELPPQPTLDDDDDSDSSRSPSPTRDQNIFRALPLPKSSTDSGHAGMVGVPKVPKRPSTVPNSPVLGFRRRTEWETTGAAEGAKAGAGAATQGIPTVRKRPTTVPRSPLLGLRRFAQQKLKGASESSTTDTVTTQPAESQSQQWTRRSASSSLSASTSVTPLVGLHLVESGSQIAVPAASRKEDRSHRSVVKDRHLGNEDEGYRPHSTARAAERAQFQAKKVELEKERQETLSRLRRHQVKELKREMQALRSSLS